MIGNTMHNPRRGSVLPLTVLTLVGMCGFVGLTIDIGLIAVVRTQCQTAADAGAMSGARAVDGTVSQNLGTMPNPAVGTAAYIGLHTAMANPALGVTFAASNVNLVFGTWHYDAVNQVFTPAFPDGNGNLPAGDNYNLCQVTVSYDLPMTFAAAFAYIDPSFQTMTHVSSVAQAAHRPRDVCIILDYSGSMNNESDLWNCEGYLDNGQTHSNNNYTWPKSTNPNYTSNNLETVYPQFGPYSNGNNYSDYTCYPNLLCPASTDVSAPSNYFNTPVGGPPATAQLIGKSNVSISALGVQAMVGDYYSYSPSQSGAFTARPDSYATAPLGDNYLQNQDNTSNTWTSPAGTNYSTTVATTVADVLGSSAIDTNWETYGYSGGGGSSYKDVNSNTVSTFKGYTVGPRYWGKTFFIWPPDPSSTTVTAATPSGTKDWRKNFFFESDGTTRLDDNTLMFKNSYPGYLDPPGNYVINYKAILAWLKSTGINPFPSQMQSGSVLFYSQIPDDVPASAYNHSNSNANIANADQRFWKEYIDYTLGVWRAPDNGIQHTQQPSCSIGPDFVFGSVQINAKPSVGNPSDTRYMDYKDNVWRPRHRLWFGPMTMIQFLSDTGKLPGTAHDISMYPMKSGVGAALKDIQNNHPNDKVALLPFHRPAFSNDPPNNGSFNNPQYSLNNDYTSMLNSLWLPNISSGTVPPWDTLTVQIPRAHGDWCANTSSSYGFMLAYNQYTSAATVKTAGVGGLGRKGSTRLIIYETDGMANEDSQPTGGNALGNTFYKASPKAAYNSYYPILPGQTVNGAGYSATNLLQVVETICNKDDGTPYKPLPTTPPYPSTVPNVPGFATANKSVVLHCIVFGAIFETPNTFQTQTVPLLQQISNIGGTVFPAAATPTSAELAADPTTAYKWCIGTIDQRRTKLEKAILQIFDSSVPVSLIQ